MDEPLGSWPKLRGGLTRAMLAGLLGADGRVVRRDHRRCGVRAGARAGLRVGAGAGQRATPGAGRAQRGHPPPDLSPGWASGWSSPQSWACCLVERRSCSTTSCGRSWCGREWPPWRYDAFLEAMVQRLLLRRSGNAYLFVHRLLRDYLAEPDPDRVQAAAWCGQRLRAWPATRARAPPAFWYTLTVLSG